jgi:two-component system response regulator HydG
MRHILLVDDEPKLGRVLATALQSAGYTVERVLSGSEALAKLASMTFDVVVTDLKLPDISGIQVLQHVRELPSAPDVIMMTAYASAETAVEAMRLGAVDYLIKPFSIDELRIKIARLIGRRALQEQNGNLQAQLEKVQSIESLVGTSARMREVIEQIHQVAATDATVLLLGESGTGKTVLARAIHHHSRRRNGPLCEVHCAALPPTLLESELFGHERGAFTGAVEQRIGHVEKADRGTLFLDEIGDVPPLLQVKLLRFIQDHQFHRVGSVSCERSTCGLSSPPIATWPRRCATRRCARICYYRINVFPIHLPALRERSDDIPKLVHDILRRRHPLLSINQPALDLLQRYPWPGNIRELENILERAAILVGTGNAAGQNVIGVEHLPRAFADSRCP